ncbi:MAG TPA: type II toxin-antitoxin system VapC family toxin [Bryobacteraceae bacterium]|nr:type II toxin-antitoxin system VapC family toxin [Bryobacteraceae bacterium]
MIIDSSAVLALVFEEPESARIATAIAAATRRRMSTVNWLETLMVVEGRLGVESADDAQLILRELEVEALPFDREQMIEARAAWRRFGKGRHPAALNLGDCCAYAAALVTGDELLYKGDDFSKTDIAAVAW